MARIAAWTIAGLLFAIRSIGASPTVEVRAPPPPSDMPGQPRPSKGEYPPYQDVRTLTAQTGDVLCIHRHNWSKATLDSRRRMIAGHQDPFRDDNDYASLECVEVRTKDRLFKTPVPALMHLWISPDGQYIVGLSDLDITNPYHLAVFAVDGRLIYRAHMTNLEACFEEPEFRTFVDRNPLQRALLLSHSVVENGKVYIDFAYMGAPLQYGRKVWVKLYDHSCKSHISPNIIETTGGWVEWYDEANPNLALVRDADGKATGLTLRDYAGQPIAISFTPRTPSAASAHPTSSGVTVPSR